MSGVLYIVSTPIGNLKDITLRAVEVLKGADAVIAEDTRRTLKLFNHLGIKKELISYYDPVEKERTPLIIARLLKGERLALVSDAGTPLLSDPGYRLVVACIENKIDVVPIPGPSSVLAALVASGLPPHPFSFWGFLPRGERRRRLLRLLSLREETLIFFESPNRLRATLEDILECMGDRRCCVAREMTKVHEEFLRGKVSEVIEQLKGREILGEICLVVEGTRKSPEEWEKAAAKLINAGFTRKETARIVSVLFDVPRNTVYKSLNP